MPGPRVCRTLPGSAPGGADSLESLSVTVPAPCEAPRVGGGRGVISLRARVSSQTELSRWPRAAASGWGRARDAHTGRRLSKEVPLGRVTEEPELCARGNPGLRVGGRNLGHVHPLWWGLGVRMDSRPDASVNKFKRPEINTVSSPTTIEST